jgi:peptidoglycan hydrolase CwlO-like protein
MKKKNIVLTIFLGVFSLSFFFGLSRYYEKPVFAEVSCPSYIDPDSLECLDYLREQMGIVQDQQSSLQRQLEAEEYEQLSLQEKINYINNRISWTENNIRSLEVQIAAHNIEIKLLEDSIQKMEDNISVLGQEITTLEGAVTKRVTESYKYSFVGPLELFLDSKSFSSILRKTKYLIVTRNQDRLYLEEYSVKSAEIKNEEDILNEEKAELQATRNAIDENRIELAETRNDLSAQKDERERLLAESKVKEAELLAAYQANIKKVADLDKAIINYINTHQSEIVDEGWVTTEMPIGRMGDTGLSNGAHLHFGLNSGKKYVIGGFNYGYFWSDINLFSRGYLVKGPDSFLQWGPPCSWGTPCPWWSPLIYAGSVRVPLSGAYILMTQDEHQGNAIDMVSYSRNEWGYKNEGAPIYPIMDGQLYKGVDGYGGKYAVVYHSNGTVSVYLHLQ